MTDFSVLLHRKYGPFNFTQATIILIFGLTFLISLGTFIFRDRPLGRFTLEFPHQMDHRMVSETRLLPITGNDQIALVVKESLLGPMNPSSRRLFPMGTRLNSLIREGDDLYLDLSYHTLINPESYLWWSPEDSFKTLSQTLRFNFSFIKEVYITVNGQVPFRETSEKK